MISRHSATGHFKKGYKFLINFKILDRNLFGYMDIERTYVFAKDIEDAKKVFIKQFGLENPKRDVKFLSVVEVELLREEGGA